VAVYRFLFSFVPSPARKEFLDFAPDLGPAFVFLVPSLPAFVRPLLNIDFFIFFETFLPADLFILSSEVFSFIRKRPFCISLDEKI